jgi:thiol-disulfide isomerase/thioredoxin
MYSSGSPRSLVACALFAIALGACQHAPTSAAPAAPNSKPAAGFRGALPDIEVEGLDGKAKSLREVTKGKVVVVDLWATWCGACREVSSRAAELAQSTTDADFMVVGVAEGEETSTISSFLGNASPPYAMYVDHQFDLSEDIGAEEIPTILVVDRNGKVRSVSKKLDAATVHLVGELLAEKPTDKSVD